METRLGSLKFIGETPSRIKKLLQTTRGNDSQFSLIIKATDSASFKNFIDITDEVTINDVKRYYIDELTDAEKIKMTE